MKEEIRRLLLEAGAVEAGFAEAGEIDSEVDKTFAEWIKKGKHGVMSYLERHRQLRFHTDHVLPGAKTVIAAAFPYYPDEDRLDSLPYMAAYAHGEDYHITIRERLKPLVDEFQSKYGGKWRVCIDSAPVAERYWALKSGVGKIGLNGAVIVKGAGSLCFLAEILTTVSFPPDESSELKCKMCGACIKICPSKALNGDGTMDARRCINYLTIEKKGDFTLEEQEILNRDVGYIFGCDRCLRICPENRLFQNEKTKSENVILPFNESLKSLEPSSLLQMTEETFKNKFSRSPLSYAGFPRLIRNALTLMNHNPD